jgi:hypothetical protein
VTTTLGGIAEHHQASGSRLIFETPDHGRTDDLRIYERYDGLRGQERLGLVDGAGRVWHYDTAEVSWVVR